MSHVIDIIHNCPFSASELKYRYEENGGKNFFTRGTMRFFGDTMRNYGVRLVKIGDRELYELFRRKPVNGGLFSSTYFDSQTYKIVSIYAQAEDN